MIKTKTILTALLFVLCSNAFSHIIMMQMMGEPEAGGGVVRLGWDPDGDYGAGDDYSAQVELGAWVTEAVYRSIPITTPATWSCSAMSLNVYMLESTTADAHSVRGAIYNSSGSKLTNGDTDTESSIGLTYDWYSLDFPTVPTLATSTSYSIVVGVSGGAGAINIRAGTSSGDCTNPLPGTTCGVPGDGSVTNLPPTALDSTVTLGGNGVRTMALYLECTQ